jgi:hypothetical protein
MHTMGFTRLHSVSYTVPIDTVVNYTVPIYTVSETEHCQPKSAIRQRPGR